MRSSYIIPKQILKKDGNRSAAKISNTNNQFSNVIEFALNMVIHWFHRQQNCFQIIKLIFKEEHFKKKSLYLPKNWKKNWRSIKGLHNGYFKSFFPTTLISWTSKIDLKWMEIETYERMCVGKFKMFVFNCLLVRFKLIF